MDHEHLAVVEQGAAAIEVWIQQHPGFDGFDLRRANLSDLNLDGAWLECVKLDYSVIRSTTFRGAKLLNASFEGAQLLDVRFNNALLSKANLQRTSLYQCNLADAHLWDSDLSYSRFDQTNCSNAKFTRAIAHAARWSASVFDGCDFFRATLGHTDLSHSSFVGADFRYGDLQVAKLHNTALARAQMNCTQFYLTSFSNVDLSEVQGLEEALHNGPSTVGIDTLAQSAGKIHPSFLQGCGVPKWCIDATPLFQPTLTAREGENILVTEVFMSRFFGPNSLNGVFISYSHEDAGLADRLHASFVNAGVSCWQDKHHATAGPLGKMIKDAIRSRDMVLLILSQHSLKSDWVWHEYETARSMELAEGRTILCPVAVDDAWSHPEKYEKTVQDAVVQHGPKLARLKTYNIIPFGRGYSFDDQFDKIIRGMLKYYGPPT
ncbi:MAG TPA: toll/interleukin-1 receptor domain-containing protein [Planctomycetaceae bacterium]|jgi:uncharacterized protein YjbI with pentapeptide repeats|nr:toll/interleukin-1 receptor domain-containing protein [Planctomycetaceae bacterium]